MCMSLSFTKSLICNVWLWGRIMVVFFVVTLYGFSTYFKPVNMEETIWTLCQQDNLLSLLGTQKLLCFSYSLCVRGWIKVGLVESSRRRTTVPPRESTAEGLKNWIKSNQWAIDMHGFVFDDNGHISNTVHTKSQNSVGVYHWQVILN